MAKVFGKFRESPIALTIKQLELSFINKEYRIEKRTRSKFRHEKFSKEQFSAKNSLKGSLERNPNLLITNSVPYQKISPHLKSHRKIPLVLHKKIENHRNNSALNQEIKENHAKQKIKYVVDSVFRDTPLRKTLKKRPMSAKFDNFSQTLNIKKNNRNDSDLSFKDKSVKKENFY